MIHPDSVLRGGGRELEPGDENEWEGAGGRRSELEKTAERRRKPKRVGGGRGEQTEKKGI